MSQNNDGNKPQMILLTGLWLKKSKGGVSYMSGTMGQNKVLLYKNTRKTKDTAPDYLLYIAPPMPRETGESEPLEGNPFSDLLEEG